MASYIGVGRYLHVVGVEGGLTCVVLLHKPRFGGNALLGGFGGDSPSRFFFAFEVLFNEFCEVFNHKIVNSLASQRVGLYFFKE